MGNATFRNVIVPRILTIYSFAIFVIFWVGLAFTMIVNPALLDQIWNWRRRLAFIAGDCCLGAFSAHYGWLWIWESSWPMIFRWLATAELVGWKLLPVSNLIKGK